MNYSDWKPITTNIPLGNATNLDKSTPDCAIGNISDIALIQVKQRLSHIWKANNLCSIIKIIHKTIVSMLI